MQGKPVPFAKIASQRHTQKIREMLLSMPPVVDDFIRSLEDQTSSLTRLAYLYDLRLFFEYLSREIPRFADVSPAQLSIDLIRSITLKDIERYPAYLTLYYKENPDRIIENEAHGKMRKLCALRSFYNYMFRNNYVEGNLAALVPLPKLSEKPILRLEPNEVARLLDIAERGEGMTEQQHKYTARMRKRDVAILTLLLGTGIRVSECVGIDLLDVSFEENAFLVTRKGGKQMILYFSDEVAAALRDYAAEREQIKTLPGHEGALFLSTQRRRITARAVENLVKKYARVAAPLKRISPHKLRSTFATELYQNTGDIYLVADVLGHTDVNTTRRHYAAMSDEHRRRAAKAVKLRED